MKPRHMTWHQTATQCRKDMHIYKEGTITVMFLCEYEKCEHFDFTSTYYCACNDEVTKLISVMTCVLFFNLHLIGLRSQQNSITEIIRVHAF